MDWFVYNGYLRHERVKLLTPFQANTLILSENWNLCFSFGQRENLYCLRYLVLNLNVDIIRCTARINFPLIWFSFSFFFFQLFLWRIVSFYISDFIEIQIAKAWLFFSKAAFGLYFYVEWSTLCCILLLWN